MVIFLSVPPLAKCTRYSLQYSEGAGYWQLLTLDRRLLRRKRWLHATTTAEPGACYDGAMAFAAGVLRELEKGCYTKIVEPSGGVRGESCECTVRMNIAPTSLECAGHLHTEIYICLCRFLM